MRYLSFIGFMFIGMHHQCNAVNQTLFDNDLTRSIKSGLVKVGSAIDRTELPLVGRLSLILPTAAVAFALQKFPGQTLGFCATYVAYKILFRRMLVFVFLKKKMWEGKKAGEKVGKSAKEKVTFEDNFFDFDDDGDASAVSSAS
jgi:hypothetical protein